MKKHIFLILFLFNSLLGLLSTIAGTAYYPQSTMLSAAVRSAEQAAALASSFMNETVVGPHRAPATAAAGRVSFIISRVTMLGYTARRRAMASAGGRGSVSCTAT